MRIAKKMGLAVALIFTLMLTAFLATMPMAHASTITLNTVADSWVGNRYPTVNHGGDNTLHVRSDIYLPEPDPNKKNRTYRTFLKFDLSGIDPNTIDTVTLYLYCKANNTVPMDVYAHQTGDGWSEYGIDWNDQPAFGASITKTTVYGINQWYGWGGAAMKNYVKAEAAGDDTVSFVLKLFDDENPTHTANASWMYRRNFSSKEGGYSPYLEIFAHPVACFTVSNDHPNTCETVTFNASCSYESDGSIVNYEWDWEGDCIYDFNAGDNPIATHHYETYGLYYPKLRVTDNDGFTDETNITILVRGHPVAAFTYTPERPIVDEVVTFNASSSNPKGGTIVSYEWDFGDGSLPVTENDPTTNHTYTGFGTHNVTLTITDSEDLTDTFTDTVRILIHPVAAFTYSPTQPIVNETVTFNASASYDPDRYIVNYSWNFDDGSAILTTPNSVTTHNYTNEGPYNVTLTVTDDDGLTDTKLKLMTVYWKPITVYLHDVAVISVAPSLTEVYVGEAVTITVVAKNNGTATETFNITAYYDENILETRNVTDLAPGSETVLTFTWNTTGVTPGNYTISAQASIVPGETLPDQDDNTHVDGTVTVKSPTVYEFPRELAILAIIVAAAIVLTLFAFLLYRRKKRKAGIH